MKPPQLSILLTLFAVASIHANEGIRAYRTGEELIIGIDALDLLRQRHAGLHAEVKLTGDQNRRVLQIDLADPAVRGALVVDLAKFGRCDEVTVTLKGATGERIAGQTIAPLVEVPLKSPKPATSPPPAYIEPGSVMARGGVERPQIALPDLKRVRTVHPAIPSRLVSKGEIKFPVVTEVDPPIVGGVVVGRQTAEPNDTTKASLYFSCKKAIYSNSKVERWQKFLLEVPVQEAWASSGGDEEIVLKPGEFSLHITNEKSPAGRNMLNDKEGDLGQLGEMDTDEQGRIYWRIDGGGGAYVVRFNPHTKRFEQPPVQVDFQKLVPPGAGILNDGLCKVSCTRGRVYFTMCNDTLSSGNPGNPLSRRIGGVFSISQDWSDAARFAADIRLHVGSWATAQPAFYQTPPKADAVVRKLGGCTVTEAGLFITTAEAKYEGGPWRLDLDAQGHTTFFGTVKSLSDTVAADGTPLAPTKIVMFKGLPKGRELNVGQGGGRNLAEYNSGRIKLPRSSIRLLTHGVEGINLIKVSKHVSTYEGAPQGTITLRLDLIDKLRSHPDARGPLADSLNSGSSMGPAFMLSPIPGEAGRATAVCEYAGYPLSVLDFSGIKARKSVTKTPLPAGASATIGLGPYHSTWVANAGEQWLYVSGYTGLSRVLYSKGGKALTATNAEVFNPRLAQRSVDGHSRTSMKKIDYILPVFGGRLMDSGYGISGRGGDAYSTGVELFDPRQLTSDSAATIVSQTSAHLSRCFALRTLQGRMVWSAQDGSKRQQIFAASGSVRKQFINELQDPSIAPANLDAKIFLYEVSETEGLRDLYGFALPKLASDQATEGHVVLSPCNRFLIILTQDGVMYSYSIAGRQFVDAAALRDSTGAPIRLLEFKRPSEIIFASPDGQIFFVTEPFDQAPASLNFNRVVVGDDGGLNIEPYLAITFDAREGFQDFRGIVRCFLPDLANNDGSYDFVLGYAQQSVEPFVRVIADYIGPRSAP